MSLNPGRRRSRWAVTTLVLAGLLQTASASGQTPAPGDPLTVETDPIRCWWRTSTGAVRTGETFSVVLTCAVLDVDAIQVVPDETKLGAAVVQMTPFEVVSGTHPPDLRAGQRRFFQYEYVLRAISSDMIGKDIPLPNLQIPYRVNSRLEGNAALQGRELTYLLPPQTIRVMSMVPGEAADIRDTADAEFGRIEALTSRASLLEVIAITLVALGSIMTVLALIGLFRRPKAKATAVARGAGAFAVASLASRELARVQSEVAQHGWTPPLVDRALAATRIAAALALDRGVNQQPIGSAAEPGDGRLVLPRLLRRGKALAVSSPVTAADVAKAVNRLPATVSPARRRVLEPLRDALSAFAAAQYGRATADRQNLDAALDQALAGARQLRTEKVWPRDAVRRLIAGSPEPQRQT